MEQPKKEWWEDFEINEHKLITTPGKFGGCPRYVPFYWDIGMNGVADRETTVQGRLVWGFDIAPEDKKRFPELKKRHTVKLVETEQGFVTEL